ncbi:DUF3017 domain-containing protein [Gephyromycinifex aptenodytis]|uniref:DUF3017 domain-containing protein n=1 Tax=Gephyromycinifex aptenodytis TaxID=2716227 RepID=UPI001B2FF76A|nr:DUF3017 domain-containing protein [Gephyromycinifex aptenodytis]
MRLGPGWWVAFLALLAGFALVAVAGRILLGGLVMGTGFLVAALVRAFFSDADAAGLCIRNRTIDVLLYGLSAIAVIVSATLVHLREFI